MDLSSHYHRPDFPPAQAQRLIANLVEDLEEYPIVDIENAARSYRRDPKSRFFPKPGELRGLIAQARRERADLESRPRKIIPLGRPSRWHDRPKSQWKAGWLETEVPIGELIRDEPGSRLREPNRDH